MAEIPIVQIFWSGLYVNPKKNPHVRSSLSRHWKCLVQSSSGRYEDGASFASQRPPPVLAQCVSGARGFLVAGQAREASNTFPRVPFSSRRVAADVLPGGQFFARKIPN